MAELEQEANRAAEDLLARFWSRDDLSAASWLQLIRVQGLRRDYKAAVTAYERSLAKGDPSAPDLRAMGSRCIVFDAQPRAALEVACSGGCLPRGSSAAAARWPAITHEGLGRLRPRVTGDGLIRRRSLQPELVASSHGERA